MQTESKFAIIFFVLICIEMGVDEGLNKFGEFNYIYKSFNVFCVSDPFVYYYYSQTLEIQAQSF